MAIINFTDKVTSLFDEDALTTSTPGELVINFGDLTTTGDLANGIFAGANDVTIRHFGRVETNGLGAAGIFVQGENARIENYGSVVTHGDYFGDFEFFSEGIFVLGDGFYMANYGLVQVEGESSSAMVGLGTDGKVINFNVVRSSAAESTVIVAVGDHSQVINAGKVTVTGSNSAALWVAGADASAINLGQIVVTSDSGIAMQGALGDTHLSNQGVIRVTADESEGMGGFFGNGHELSNFGLIEMEGAFAIGIAADGAGPPFLPPAAGSDHEIVNAGRISTDGDGGIGVALGMRSRGFLPAEFGEIENHSVIETEGDGAAGVAMIGNDHALTNSGRITSDGGAFDSEAHGVLRAAGVLVSGDDALVKNTDKGVIESKNADSAAVELNVLERDGLPAAGMSSTLENFGLIKGAGAAVLGGAGQETVINHGRIVGDVLLGDGDDTFVFGKGGVLAGDLVLGGGDDLVVIENGAKTAHIADFDDLGDDIIDVSAFLFSNIGELMAESEQVGNDVVISLDHNDKLILADVQLGTLDAADFWFV
jgi:hypothetical protein